MKKLIALLVVPLAACSGIGEGSKPESLRFVSSTANTTEATTRSAFECLTAGSTVIAEFTNGQLGDFTSRVRYTSSDETKLKVSNGDLAVPGSTDLFFNPGVLVPVAPTAMGAPVTITAEFAGLRASQQVTVSTPSFSISAPEPFMAPGTVQVLSLQATLDGVQTELRTVGNWVLEPVDTSVAVITATTGVVTALGAGSTRTARVSFPSCTTSLSVNFEVQAPSSVRVEMEAGYPTQQAEGTLSFPRVFADFNGTAGDADDQDITFDAGTTFNFTPTGIFTYGAATGFLIANDPGSTQLTATYAHEASSTSVTSTPAIGLTSAVAMLDTVSITPDPATINRGMSVFTAQFTATGRVVFADSTVVTNYPLQHNVTWTVSDTAAAGITNSGGSAGLASSLSNANAAITVTATSSSLIPPLASGTSPSDTATLNVTAAP